MQAWLGLAVGVIALLTALVVFRTTVLSGRATRDKVAEIHVLVNGRLDEALVHVDTLTARVDQLEAAIVDRGGTVPEAPDAR